MRFAVLGPVRVTSGDSVVRIDRAQRRAVLAYLLLNAGRTVPADVLVDALWGEEPPESAKPQIHAAVSVIRRALRTAGQDPISSEPSGYRLMAATDELDLSAFTAGVAEAQTALAAGAPQRAAHLLREALGLWQGEPLAGITAAFVDSARAHLTERHLAAFELLADVELGLGRQQELVLELAARVEANPLREKLTEQLMLALFRCGRSADALAAYQRIRHTLADELGIDPTPDLQRLHQQILNNDPELATSTHDSARTKRRFLPGDIPDFTGRASQMSTLDKFAAEPATAPATVVISAIAGTGGVGKTALAVRWAHHAAVRFPDGQLYVNLRGYDPRRPLAPIEALGQLLRSLGVPPEQVPHDEDEAVALYRNTIADLRLLVLLDNARSVEQVRPLLPSGPECMALITSRDRLSGLVVREGARRLTLDTLAPDEAAELLSRILGAERVAAEPQAAAALAEICGYLPLALRIAACNVAERPDQSIAEHVRDLNADRIGELTVEGDADSAIRVVFGWSYRHLSTLECRVFRLLGLIPGADFTAGAVAALTNLPGAQCATTLDRLAAGHLVNPARGDRYGLHDLVRAYAAGLAAEVETEADRRLAVSRLLNWMLRRSDGAAQLVTRQPALVPEGQPPDPGFDSIAAGMAWLDVERANLLAAVEFAAHQGYPDHAWRLGCVLRNYLGVRRARVELTTVATLVAQVAESLGDPRALAAADLIMTEAYHHNDRNREGTIAGRNALARAESLGWTDLSAVVLKALHLCHLHISELTEASHWARRSLELEIARGRVAGQDYGRLALVDMQRGALASAAANFEEALRLGEADGAFHINVITRINLGEIYRLLGRLDEAHSLLSRALQDAPEMDNHHVTAIASSNLACTLRDLGRLAEALEQAGQSLEILRPVADDVALTYARHAHATTLAELGRLDEAAQELEAALPAAQHRELHYPQAEMLVALADTELRLGHDDKAWAHATAARELAERSEFRVHFGQSLDLLALLHRRAGRVETAQALARQASRVHAETGYRSCLNPRR